MAKELSQDAKITLGISISDHFSVPWGFVESVIKVVHKYPNVAVMKAHGSLIHDNRNWLIKHTTADRMLMVDTDMTFTPEMFEQINQTMDETGADIVGGAYRSGYEPHRWNVFLPDLSRVEELPVGVFDVGGLGMGFTLIKNTAFGGEAPFDPIIDAQERHGEDVSFCIRARQRGLKVVCDPTILPGHLRLKPV